MIHQPVSRGLEVFAGQTGTLLRPTNSPRDTLQTNIVHSLQLVVQGPASFEIWSNFCTTYNFGATRCQICPIFTFSCLFSHTKRQKSTLLWQAYSTGVTSQECLRLFPCSRRMLTRVSFAGGVFLRLLVRELRTPKVA